MLDAAVLGEIEDRVLAEPGGVEIAGMNQQFVRLGPGLDDDLAVGIDDQLPPNKGWPSSTPAFATPTTQVEFW